MAIMSKLCPELISSSNLQAEECSMDPYSSADRDLRMQYANGEQCIDTYLNFQPTLTAIYLVTTITSTNHDPHLRPISVDTSRDTEIVEEETKALSRCMKFPQRLGAGQTWGGKEGEGVINFERRDSNMKATTKLGQKWLIRCSVISMPIPSTVSRPK
ncbi:hypothetical protein K440DRAFT_641564 [Wilcoxina mikolae CBS 423.85]|nr:hypothetical protein K440DRAFT_641564 [Wilcoxina mikolae CBS 423.85]